MWIVELNMKNASSLKQSSFKLSSTIQPIFNHCSTSILTENIIPLMFSGDKEVEHWLKIGWHYWEIFLRKWLNVKIIDEGRRILELKYLFDTRKSKNGVKNRWKILFGTYILMSFQLLIIFAYSFISFLFEWPSVKY